MLLLETWITTGINCIRERLIMKSVADLMLRKKWEKGTIF
jgi:hypothetical protein